jgi:hypothetical protein
MNWKHTPGPWFLSKSKHIGGEHVVAMLAEDKGDRSLVVHAQHGDPIQDEANAHLIAAAPELLKALDLALEYWAHRQQRYSNRLPVWVVAARAAIIKATGV